MRPPALGPAAGLVGLAVLGAALGLALGTHPVPTALLAAAGVGMVSILALAVVRYDVAVAVGVLLLPIVRVEPAPVDGVFAVIIALSAVTNRLELRRVPLSMSAFAGAFLALNLLSGMDAVDLARAASFGAITVYLVMFGAWVAIYVDRERRVRMIVRLYVLVAVLSAVVASAALFVHFPGSTFLLTVDGERAQGLFKDPNVYGPFLVPAALILVQEALHPRLLRLNRLAQLLCFLALAAGIVFSYSRAAWLNLVVGMAVTIVVTALRRGGSRRVFALMTVVIVALGALSWAIVASGSLSFLEQRARFQTYDTQRFGAQKSGIELAQRMPLGVGPGQFEDYSPVSAHSTYVRALAEEGLLGATVVLGLMVGTLVLASRNAVLGRETYGLGSTALLAAWCGLLANSVFIDTLHWRHLWLLAGFIWAGVRAPLPGGAQLSSSAGRAAVR